MPHFSDVRGLSVTAANGESARLLDEAVDSYLGARSDTRPRLDAVIHADPDFAFAHCRLIVELDGACHAGRAARRKDAKRSARLRASGWRIIRFWNSELRAPTVVMKAILTATRADTP